MSYKKHFKPNLHAKLEMIDGNKKMFWPNPQMFTYPSKVF